MKLDEFIGLQSSGALPEGRALAIQTPSGGTVTGKIGYTVRGGNSPIGLLILVPGEPIERSPADPRPPVEVDDRQLFVPVSSIEAILWLSEPVE